MVKEFQDRTAFKLWHGYGYHPLLSRSTVIENTERNNNNNNKENEQFGEERIKPSLKIQTKQQ